MSSIFLRWFFDVDPKSDQTHHKLITLAQAKFPILPGFIITTEAYVSFLKENDLDRKIKQLLSTISMELPDSLMQGEKHIKKLFEQAELSDTFISELTRFYERIGKNEITLTIHEKELQGRKHKTIHVISEHQLLKEIKNIWAEMFASHALWHRHHNNLNHLQAGAEIIIQKEIKGETRGFAITIDPMSHEKDKLIIITSYPHSEDKYILSKKTLSIIDRKLSYQSNIPKLSHDDILKIAKAAKDIENYLYFPQEIEWMIDDNKLFILEVRPITSVPRQQTTNKTKRKKLPIARGKGITDMIGTGRVFIIKTEKDLQKIRPHDVIIISNLETKHLKHLKKPRAIIIESNHFPTQISITLKQKGIPAVANIKHASRQLQKGFIVTVHGGKGEIYLGGIL